MLCAIAGIADFFVMVFSAIIKQLKMLSTLPRLAAFIILLLPAVLSPQAAAQQPTLDCSTGPALRTYGSTPWLVYTCSDGKSVVVISSPGSPAAPFYFMFSQKNGKYALVGEGTAPKSQTDPAYAELVRLKDKDIAGLIQAAKQAKAGGGKQ